VWLNGHVRSSSSSTFGLGGFTIVMEGRKKERDEGRKAGRKEGVARRM
jgi:hypothetical protein